MTDRTSPSPAPQPRPGSHRREIRRAYSSAQGDSRTTPAFHSADERTVQAQNLAQLADQLQALARELDRPTADRERPLETEASKPPEGSVTKRPPEQDQFLRAARARYQARRKRVSVFEAEELFGEPAWDILLDLYIAYAEGKSVSVSSACIGSASPPTTGLRWLGVLQEAALVEREHDPRDQRRVLVRLSPTGIERMETYFREAFTPPQSAVS